MQSPARILSFEIPIIPYLLLANHTMDLRQCTLTLRRTQTHLHIRYAASAIPFNNPLPLAYIVNDLHIGGRRQLPNAKYQMDKRNRFGEQCFKDEFCEPLTKEQSAGSRN